MGFLITIKAISAVNLSLSMSYSTGGSRIVLPAGPRLLAYAKRIGMLGAQSQKKNPPPHDFRPNLYTNAKENSSPLNLS